jgi:AAA domain
LRKEGFKDANTVAAFLGDQERQENLRDGGLIWVDEAGMLAIDELETLCKLAKSLDARIILQGDPKQHRAVDRDGNMLEVLATYGGLPVAKLTKIQRQKGEYADAVAAIRDREFVKADAILRKLGWVIEGEGHDALVAEYARAIEEKKPNGEFASVIVIDPTHKDGDILTEKLRALRKEKGLITGEEKTFPRLEQLDMTPAQRADAEQYNGDEVIQFFRRTGQFKAGQRVNACEVLPHLADINAKYFGVFRETEVKFAVGDKVRITNNGRDVTGKHRLDNGTVLTVKKFTKDGDTMLSNGWVIGKDFAHFKHGLVETSPGTQSKTEDIVLTALNKASLGAMSAAQQLVTISRGRARGMVFTDMSQAELLNAIARDDSRKSATELFYEPPAAAPAPLATADRVQSLSRYREFIARVQATTRHWRLMNERNGRLAVEHRQQQERAVGFER